MNLNRGRESRLHREAKAIVGRLFDDPDWSVFYEQRNADILVLHHKSRFVAAIELETSPRNVLRNLQRNADYGCRVVAVVALTERFSNQIVNKVWSRRKSGSPEQVRTFTYNGQGLRELRDWIMNFAETKNQKTEKNQ
ncbi:hypothetical protein P4B35_10135 [Pontiellaceae bacterium B12227]|nr:hypothetical protein [Pontiellaceae bacterium B12227]